MLMMHSVMMMSLLLRMMFTVVLATPVRRIGMINHVNAEAGLASPDLDEITLGHTHLLLAGLMILMSSHGQTGAAIRVLKFPRPRRTRPRRSRCRTLLMFAGATTARLFFVDLRRIP